MSVEMIFGQVSGGAVLVGAVLLLSTNGCAAVGTSVAVSASETQSQINSLQFEELEALRINAGLTRDQFMQEVRRMDPQSVRAYERAQIIEEAQRRTHRPYSEMSLPRDLPPDLRARYEALPKGKGRWEMRHLVYRARRLLWGATEKEVLAELRVKYPRWKGPEDGQ